MENVMTRLCLLACLALAGSLLLQHDLAVAGYQASTNTRVAQDDNSGNAQTPEAAAPNGSGDDSNSPADDTPPQDKE
jgi:hypothetical protein